MSEEPQTTGGKAIPPIPPAAWNVPSLPLLSEKWECTTCGSPCRVEIIYSENDITKAMGVGSRFRARHCPCKERFTDWKLIESNGPSETVQAIIHEQALLAIINEQEQLWRQRADIEDSPLGGNVVKAALYRGTATGLKMAEQIILQEHRT